MAADKPPYRLTVKLDSARPDALSQALTALRDIASEHDQAGEAEATVILESFKEAQLLEIREAFEAWLWKYKIGLGCKIRLDSPGVRPEMITVLRARHETPMDQAGWGEDEEAEREPIIIAPPLALPEPGAVPMLVDEGSYTVEE